MPLEPIFRYRRKGNGRFTGKSRFCGVPIISDFNAKFDRFETRFLQAYIREASQCYAPSRVIPFANVSERPGLSSGYGHTKFQAIHGPIWKGGALGTWIDFDRFNELASQDVV